ncbi:MAG: hydroxysqualene dehydroxylase HpnE [Acetobacteraceae bacterium]|nr:hydroxysqualene dehydroxylase HpnE [Acetobacteraceae bacterium]
MSIVHVIGAGLAGLSAALVLSEVPGRAVILYEGSPAAGGRCRSYYDRTLALQIDNGNHLLLSGNDAAAAYLKSIGAADKLDGPDRARFPFIDLKTNERWTVRPNNGRIPWWILSASRRIPATRLSDYLELMSLVRLKDDTPVADAMRRGRLYWRLVEPLAIASLNTRPHSGLARLLGAVMRDTLLRGGKACIPRYPKAGLSEALIDPAIAKLQERGAKVLFNHRIVGMAIERGRVASLRTADETIVLNADDAVVMAVPPWVAVDLVPDLIVPDEFESILNIHFKFIANPKGPLGDTGFIGVLGGTAEWIFQKRDHISVTISAANQMIDNEPEAIAEAVWTDICAALDIVTPLPPFRVIKEKRATFAATARQDLRRPRARTQYANLALAGDWTATGLPATIEGAIRSGRTAANVLLTA